MSGQRRGFFRDALAGLKKLADEADAPPSDETPRPSFVPPPHRPAGGPRSAAPAEAPKARVSLKLCLNDWRNQRALEFVAGGALEAVDESPCERCVDWCPEPGAITLGDDTLPRVDVAKCTGCGACAEHCAAYPQAITIR